MAMATRQDVATTIADLVRRARQAQQVYAQATQEQVDALTARVAWAGVRPDVAQRLAETLVAESGMGCVPDKIQKLRTKIKGAYRDMKGRKSVGVVSDDPRTGIVKIAKPVGVIGGILPVTNGEATPFVKVLGALKTRNAIILSPHPKGVQTCNLAVAAIRAVLKKHGWPEDLVIGIDPVCRDASMELMKQCDLVIATGSMGLVNAAYTSGTPCFGVGAGNAVCVIDETADLRETAGMIMRSKTFDHASSCSTENALAIQESVYDAMLRELEAVGGYLVNAEEKARLQAAMWNSETQALNRAIVARPAAVIAEVAGIRLPAGRSFFLVPETGIGKGFPFSGEKLSVVAAVYRWKTFAEAIDLVNRGTAHGGPGHSCSIHTADEARARELALQARVARIMIRQPQSLGNSGSWTNGMPMSLTLGCGTWGGNISSSNITWEQMLNFTWVSYPISSTEPSDEELFGAVMREE